MYSLHKLLYGFAFVAIVIASTTLLTTQPAFAKCVTKCDKNGNCTTDCSSTSIRPPAPPISERTQKSELPIPQKSEFPKFIEFTCETALGACAFNYYIINLQQAQSAINLNCYCQTLNGPIWGNVTNFR
jgi:hypothetical protein